MRFISAFIDMSYNRLFHYFRNNVFKKQRCAKLVIMGTIKSVDSLNFGDTPVTETNAQMKQDTITFHTYIFRDSKKHNHL